MFHTEFELSGGYSELFAVRVLIVDTFSKVGSYDIGKIHGFIIEYIRLCFRVYTQICSN